MHQLTKITISNARRFGKDIEINLGPGATIILAPNGTGKTTVFEAIEFALTGAIQRLNPPPNSLIRDNQAGLSVRLDFEDGKFCQADYQKNDHPVLSGDHKELFGNHNASEVPYLLRLTHLLEQRANGWFVQQNQSEVAGDLLEKLSIGRDLTKIINNKNSVTRAATDSITKAKSDLENSNTELTAFAALQNQRLSVSNEFTLRPLNSLIQGLSEIYKLAGGNDQSVEEKLNSVVAFSSQTQSALDKAIEDKVYSLTQFSKVENLIGSFGSNALQLNGKEQLIKTLSTKHELLKKEFDELKVAISTTTDNLNINKKELDALRELKNSIGIFNADTITQSNLEKELESFIVTLPDIQNRLQIAINVYESARSLLSKHKLLHSQEIELISQKSELDALSILLIDWQKHQEKISDLTNNQIPKLIAEKTIGEKQVADAKTELDTKKTSIMEIQNRLNSLKSVSDTILGAVGIIATNLPKDQANCPVCDAVYEPSELQIRMAKALELVDPIILATIEENNLMQAEHDLKNKEFETFKSGLNKILEDIQTHEQTLRELNTIINGTLIPKFSGSENYLLATEWLKAKKSQSEIDLSKVEIDGKLLGKEPTLDEISELAFQKEQHEREVENVQKHQQDSLLKLNSIKQNLEGLKQKIGTANLISTNTAYDKIEQIITTVTNELTVLIQKQEQIQTEIDNINKSLVTEKGLITQLTSQQNEIRSAWLQANLEGEPLLDELNKKRTVISNEENNLQVKKAELNKISEELGRWKSAEQFQQYDNEIKEMCGTLSEEDYLNQLSQKSKTLEMDFHDKEEKKKTLTTLFSKVTKEIEMVHNYIKAINPLWSSFLKRVVVNPRFSEISLNSYSYYNKNNADVQVILHDDKVKVMEVASEAQITDLQLTFMLSMAKTYQWTPWKALLLDDPTQHHDLVHAAGVFDLLRDTIVDEQFQILLGTHDNVQASFFQRKLQNDGVPVRVWNLLADNSGVKAEIVE